VNSASKKLQTLDDFFNDNNHNSSNACLKEEPTPPQAIKKTYSTIDNDLLFLDLSDP